MRSRRYDSRRSRSRSFPATGDWRRQSRAGKSFVLLASALVLVLWFVSPLPDLLVEHIVAGISTHDDVELGLAAVRAQHYRRLESQQVEVAGQRVLAAASVHHPEQIALYDWSFTQIDEQFANAFAFPGGQIFVTRGLLSLVDADELAAVLGHEIGHVLERHGQKRLVREHLGQLVLRAVSHGDGDGRTESLSEEIGGLLVDYAAQLGMLSYSRQNEYDADAVGWYLSTGIGNARSGAMQSFLRKLGQDGHGWHSTHPSSHNRIAAIADMEQRRASRTNPLIVPPALRGGSTGGDGTPISYLWTAWQELAPVTQDLIVYEGLETIAGGLESVWGMLALDDRFSLHVLRSQKRRADRDCEDGESKISFSPLEDGKYVRLGNGKCLSTEDLQSLQRTNQLERNPYTRGPFTYAQKIDIEDLLRGVPVIYD